MKIIYTQKDSVEILTYKILESTMICILESDIILLTNVFENFRKMCVEIYELDPVKCISAPDLA